MVCSVKACPMVLGARASYACTCPQPAVTRLRQIPPCAISDKRLCSLLVSDLKACCRMEAFRLSGSRHHVIDMAVSSTKGTLQALHNTCACIHTYTHVFTWADPLQCKDLRCH